MRSPQPSLQTHSAGRPADRKFMARALTLAERGLGFTSPNPMVGAVLVRSGRIIGEGFHTKAGQPHAEIEALRDAGRRGADCRGATLYVTLEPCSTHGRTPPCTGAILEAGIRRVVVASTDPNPVHQGRGLDLLRKAGVAVETGVMEAEAMRLNEAFFHWIVHRTPWITLKAGMTLDGKIATAGGESKWITGPKSRAHSMRLRQSADAILVGVNTVIADNPSLGVRRLAGSGVRRPKPSLRRIILDSRARTPMEADVVLDASAPFTVIVTSRLAPAARVARLKRRVEVWKAPLRKGRVSIPWVLKRLGREGVTHLLVEGGGGVHGAFVDDGHVNRVAFYYAPAVLGGRKAVRAVGGRGLRDRSSALALDGVEWTRCGDDVFVTARVAGRPERS